MADLAATRRLLTCSVDGTFDESAQKTTQVTLFVYGGQAAGGYEELTAPEPVVAPAKDPRTKEGSKLAESIGVFGPRPRDRLSRSAMRVILSHAGSAQVVESAYVFEYGGL